MEPVFSVLSCVIVSRTSLLLASCFNLPIIYLVVRVSDGSYPMRLIYLGLMASLVLTKLHMASDQNRILAKAKCKKRGWNGWWNTCSSSAV
uniref:Uncharacterized protein n=1 Tax=Aegilops tauschii subsp. strangulata TaxID=200361 RepID=A0A453MBB5_AEGTS